MVGQNNSKTLLIKQVQSHAQSLCDLLACDAAAAAPPHVMERCAVATRMLAGTSSLMGLTGWERVLNAYEDLLVRYNEAGLAWDERIAQFTSELIEREETLVEAHGADASAAVESLVPESELAALGEEVEVLKEAVLAAGPVRSTAGQSAGVSPAPDSSSPPGGRASATPSSGVDDTEMYGAGIPMGGVVSELKRVYESLADELESRAFGTGEGASDRIATLRSQLHFLNFYACSLEQMINRRDPTSDVKKCSLLPLKTVLTDFANEVSDSGENALDIVLRGEQTQIDPRLLATAGAILQQMINDTFSRSEGSALAITIDATENRGAIRWRVTDNGNNFITDSQLDHEDQLAFYPGLKDVRKMLSRNHGVLWVEPRPEEDVRFEFTTPVTSSGDSFMTWGNGGAMFGVRSTQLCELFRTDEAPRGEDSFGEFLTIDGKRVPLLRLEELYREAPRADGAIAVIGSLEKRVAFYVSEAGRLVEGKTLEGVVPVWQGPTHLVAQVSDRRIALLDADQVLEGYLEVTGGLTAEGVSGGVVDDESELSNSQATFDSGERTPPDQNPEDDGDVEVLVVEQSDSLRGVLFEIFRERRIRAAFASGIDEAIELIHARSPRVIVSEFRMPTMAAKVLVEALGKDGNAIPVLVTTSQSGKTADLLVEKLGAAGYLSKPLDHDEVVSRIGGFLAEGART
jgi:two-component system OmpR family response regulator